MEMISSPVQPWRRRAWHGKSVGSPNGKRVKEIVPVLPLFYPFFGSSLQTTFARGSVRILCETPVLTSFEVDVHRLTGELSRW